MELHRSFDFEVKAEALDHQFSVLKASVREVADLCKCAEERLNAKHVVTAATQEMIAKRRNAAKEELR